MLCLSNRSKKSDLIGYILIINVAGKPMDSLDYLFFNAHVCYLLATEGNGKCA